MAKSDATLAKMREICLALPDTKETLTWGEPHFRVGEKIFAGCGGEKGKQKIGFKLTKPHADAVIHDPRFERAPYVGRHGWVSMDASKVTDWEQVRAMIHESYSLIAPKTSLAKVGGRAAAKKPKRAERR
jgi:predicted DNA-binding protein (MmcQ/YjbR family)